MQEWLWKNKESTYLKYSDVNNKYKSDYEKNKELTYLKYWDVNSLYRWEMSQKFP